MKVSFEVRGPVAIVAYSGIHGCRDADHDLDKLVRAWLEDAIAIGRTGFLFDVRALALTYPSGNSDLFNSWKPVRRAVKCRSAILWQEGVAVAGNFTNRWVLLRESLERVHPYFEDEAAAVRFLSGGDA